MIDCDELAIFFMSVMILVHVYGRNQNLSRINVSEKDS